MSAACIYDGGRDGFLATPTSKPPSKFDSIEYLERDVHDKSSIIASSVAAAAAAAAAPAAPAAGKAKKSRTSSAAGGRYNKNAGKSTYYCSSNVSAASSSATTAGAWSWGGDGNSSRANTEEVTQAASSWRAEVAGSSSSSSSSGKKPSTAPSASACSKHGKKFFWGPRVAPQGQEIDRDVRSTNQGEPATFALCVSLFYTVYYRTVDTMIGQGLHAIMRSSLQQYCLLLYSAYSLCD